MVAHRWLIRPKVGWWVRLASIAAAVTMIIAVIVSQSRSGWLTIAVFLFTCWLGLWILSEKSEHRRRYLIGILIVAVGSIVAFLFVTGVGQMLVHILVGVQQGSVQNRLGEYAGAVTEIGKNPLFGVGKFFVMYQGHAFVVHNTVLAYMSNYGVLAGLLFVALSLYVIYKAFFYLRRLSALAQRRQCLVLFAALLGTVVAIDLFAGIGSKYFFALLGCVSGVMLTYSRRRAGRSSSLSGWI